MERVTQLAGVEHVLHEFSGDSQITCASIMSRQSNMGTYRKKMTDVDIRGTQRAERGIGIPVNEKRKARHEGHD
jgi:hypothetical protein